MDELMFGIWEHLLIKIFGRLGFDPMTIMETGETNRVLFTIHMWVSILGGAFGVVTIKLIKSKLNP